MVNWIAREHTQRLAKLGLQLGLNPESKVLRSESQKAGKRRERDRKKSLLFWYVVIRVLVRENRIRKGYFWFGLLRSELFLIPELCVCVYLCVCLCVHKFTQIYCLRAELPNQLTRPQSVVHANRPLYKMMLFYCLSTDGFNYQGGNLETLRGHFVALSAPFMP